MSTRSSSSSFEAVAASSAAFAPVHTSLRFFAVFWFFGIAKDPGGASSRSGKQKGPIKDVSVAQCDGLARPWRRATAFMQGWH